MSEDLVPTVSSGAIEQRAQSHTPGPWHVGHFARDDHPCNCTSIVSEAGYMGAVALICIDNEKPISEGGNDAPPLEEAKANGRLIAAAPDLYAACRHAETVMMIVMPRSHSAEYHETWKELKAALAKARGLIP